MLFRDRQDAGRRLAQRLVHRPLGDAVVLALPRGGIIVGREIAAALRAPLDVLVACRLNAPDHPEAAFGAVAEGGVCLVDPLAARLLGVGPDALARIEAEAGRELRDRVAFYRQARPALDLAGRTAILVDDGMASGFTARAALDAARCFGAARTVLVVTVTSPHVAAAALGWADEVVCAAVPPAFTVVSEWYGRFGDDLAHAALRPLLGSPRSGEAVEVSGWRPHGEIDLPVGPPRAVVLFAHGGGSDRHSPRNRAMAQHFRTAGLASVRFDLLTPEEREKDATARHLRFDVGLLAERVAGMLPWLSAHPALEGLPIIGCGASTGAAALLVAAARLPGAFRAIFSRGGRPDLAGALLAQVRVPVLLLVGGNDDRTLALNRMAAGQFAAGYATLTVIENAGHLFEEPAALDIAAATALCWIEPHLTPEAFGGAGEQHAPKSPG